jgi:hypothetical protein
LLRGGTSGHRTRVAGRGRDGDGGLFAPHSSGYGAGAVSPLARWGDLDSSLADDLSTVAAPLAVVVASAVVAVFAAQALLAAPRLGEFCRTAPLDRLLQTVAAHAGVCAVGALAFVAAARSRPRALQSTDLGAPHNMWWRAGALALAAAQIVLVVAVEMRLGGLGFGGAPSYLRCSATAPGMFTTARWLGALQSWVVLYLFVRFAGGAAPAPGPATGMNAGALGAGAVSRTLSGGGSRARAETDAAGGDALAAAEAAAEAAAASDVLGRFGAALAGASAGGLKAAGASPRAELSGHDPFFGQTGPSKPNGDGSAGAT